MVEALDDVEREACLCEYSFVVLSVASFDPIYAKEGELVEFPRRNDVSLAA